MKHKNLLATIVVLVAIVAAVIAVNRYLRAETPILLQGTTECTTYKASSKIAGRIESMHVEAGQQVEQGELLYTLATPELDAKLEQAEAVHSAATAIDEKVLSGARVQQIEAARNLWQQAQAGQELAKKTFDRVKSLYEQGVVPAQKFDEAQAQYNALTATTAAAKAQYDLAVDGASREEKAAAAAKVRQAAGAVSEVESYLHDAMVYAPISGEVSTIIAEAGELVGSGYPVVAILDLSDQWVTFNIKETLMPKIHQGMALTGYVPALGRDVQLHVTRIAAQADYATWSATRTQGGFDIRTFAVKAKPNEQETELRPGMSVLVNWSELE
jgi:HlyD family secretion protein